MTPTKSKKCVCNDYPNWMDRIEGVVEQEGYFFTPEQLNEYIQKVIEQTLETAAEKAKVDLSDVESVTGEPYVHKESITNTFEETYKKFEV